MKKILLSLVLMVLMVSVAIADTVTLQWDGNTEPDLAGTISIEQNELAIRPQRGKG